tara:strand:- start:1645 stop:2040 length:396 start_codon:yes stop_codon:yes gene_type:complete
MKIAIVVADYNKEITSKMLAVAEKHAKELSLEVDSVVHVPGVYDIPFRVQQLLKNEEISGVVTLGAVIQGGTSHDEIVAGTTAKTLQELSLQFEKPVALGVSGPRMSKEQAEERIESTSKHAVETVKDLLG